MYMHEALKTKSVDEMTNFLYALSATDMSKCKILCGGQFCYQPPGKRACHQKLKELLEKPADEQEQWFKPTSFPAPPTETETGYNDEYEK